MKMFKRATALLLALVMIVGTVAFSASAYTVPDKLQRRLNRVYNNHSNFSVGWGLYDISGDGPKLIASKNADATFQSNCTIKAAMLFFVCKEMDAGRMSLDQKIYVNKDALHYPDFPKKSGYHKVSYILERMIHVSNSSAYEIMLRYVTKERFNSFLASLGSGTRISSYNFMGYATCNNRATEWYALYKYCHSDAQHAAFAWNLLRNARYSPIRNGLVRPVAHKCGWYFKSGLHGTAADCAVVQTADGGCYLMVIFTKNNNVGIYDLTFMMSLSRVLDDVWSDYYRSLPRDQRTYAQFYR